MSDYNRHLESDCHDKPYTHASVGGTGSISTLYMSDEELAKAKPKPLGFTAELPKKRRRKSA